MFKTRIEGHEVKVVFKHHPTESWTLPRKYNEKRVVYGTGYTECFFISPVGCELAGVAYKSHLDDKLEYVKSVARKHALEKALRNFSREERERIWADYWKTQNHR